MANPLIDLLKSCNPDPKKAGKTLLVLNAMGMLFAAASDTFAAAIDKNTPKEEKKFLIPAGVATGVAKIGIYYLMTDKIINGLKNAAGRVVDNMKPEELTKNAKDFALKQVDKAQKGLFKKSDDYVKSMKNTLFEGGDIKNSITDAAKQLYKDKTIASGSVLGSFIGAVIGCSLITPIIRDVGAYFVQKMMDKKKGGTSTQEDIKPYLDIVNSRSLMVTPQFKPMSMSNYMKATHSTGMKI